MHQQDWIAAIEMLVPNIHLPDEALLRLLCKCVPDQGITSMEEAQALLLRNFRVGGGNKDACAQWLTDMTRALLAPIPFREVFVILALFLPQLTFAEGAKLDSRLWASPAIRREHSEVQITPLSQGLRGMHEYRIAFTAHSRAAAFCPPSLQNCSFEQLTRLPPEQIHIMQALCENIGAVKEVRNLMMVGFPGQWFYAPAASLPFAAGDQRRQCSRLLQG